jgi:oxygen-independent coproporphyrinogen-3 oxidase
VRANSITDSRSFYIHWPFCPYRCHFCPFVAISGQDHLMDVYHEAIMKEIEMFAQECPVKQPLETIYLGGGTPSTWPDKLLLDMFGTIESTFDVTKISEITIEVNPGTVSKEQLDVWKTAGITRLSIGVQSLNDEVLKKLNRHQKASDVFRLIDWAEGKFESLSIDVIIGLPGIEEKEWKAMIKQIVQWPIQHVSMYFLSVHENTPLYTRLVKNELRLPPQDPIVDLYYWTVAMFEKHGLKQYEISSFARQGYESQHNQVYWDRKPYKGFGIGACSFDGTVRHQNIKNVMRYMEALKKGEGVKASDETLTLQQVHLEKVMLGLRRMKGLAVADVTESMTQEQQEKFFKRIKEFEKEGIIREETKRIYLNKASLAVENEVAIRLLR